MSITSDFMKDKLKWLQIQEKQAKIVVNELDDKSEQIENNSKAAVKQVTLFANQLTAAINQSKKKLLQDIYGLKNRLLTKANKARAAQESRVKDIEKTRKHLNKLLQTLSGTDEMVHDLLNKNHVLHCDNKRFDPTIRFYPRKEALTLEPLNIGSVYIIEEVDCSKSFIEVTQTNLEVLSTVHLYLHTYTTEGKPCIVPERFVEVEVWPERYVDKITIKESTVGNLHISFLPLISGSFVINAKIDGQKVKNSPFTMRIQHKKMQISSEIDLGVAGLKYPCGLAVAPNFTKIAVSDAYSHCLAIFRSTGELIKKIGQEGTKQGRLSCPDGVVFLNDCELAVADRDNHRVQIFDTLKGKFVCTVGKTFCLKKTFKSPWGVSVDNEGDIVVSDTYNHRIQIFDGKTMRLVKEYSFGQDDDSILPSRTISYKHLLIVADALSNNIHIIDQNEGPILPIETMGGRESIIKSLNGIAINSDGNIAVCDQDDGSVKLFTLEGHFVGKTEAKLSPVDIASLPDGSFLVIDGNSGKLLTIK